MDTYIQVDMQKPFVVLNFKTYKEGIGDNAVKLALIAEKVQKKTKLNIIVCPQHTDLKDVERAVKIPVYAQSIDNKDIGKSTGSVIAENLIEINIHGSLINHSEKRLLEKDIKELILKLKELDMKIILCVKDAAEVKKYSSLKLVRPDFIAIEPPELIGTETSVSSAKPGIIDKAVKNSNGIPILVGAGIKTNQDMQIALKEGAKGVLLASHFVKSQDPEKFLIELTKGL